MRGRESPREFMDRILIWNVRGANDQRKHRDIKKLIQEKNVGFVSLLETKVCNKEMGKLYLIYFQVGVFLRIMLGWIREE